MDKKWLETLTRSDLFKDIAPEALPEIMNFLGPRIIAVKKNEFAAISGEKFGGLGFVLEGEVTVEKEHFNGNRIIMAVLKSGEMFGEIVAFTNYGLWPATVVAQVDSRIMFIRPEKILDLCGKMSPYDRILIGNFIKSISFKAFALNRKVDYFVVKSIKGKISKYLLEQHRRTGKCEFKLPMKRGELADFLNVSRPTLSREFGKLRDEGIIDFDKDSVCLHDIEALKSLLE